MMARPRHLTVDQSGHKASTPEVVVRQSRFPSGRPPFPGLPSYEDRWTTSGFILCSCPRSASRPAAPARVEKSTSCRPPSPSYQVLDDQLFQVTVAHLPHWPRWCDSASESWLGERQTNPFGHGARAREYLSHLFFAVNKTTSAW